MTDAEYRAKYGWFEGDFSGVKSKERSQKYGEVFTPRWVVEKMLDEVPGAAEIDATVFEPACGEGAFFDLRFAAQARPCPLRYATPARLPDVFTG